MFKNIFVFAFTRPFTTTDLELHAAMHEHCFTPLGSTEMRHFGWTNSLGKGSNLTTESDGNILICARSEEKMLPAPVIKDYVEAKIEEFEVAKGRSPSKKEREQIKEDVVFELLPRAFSRVTDTHAYINAKQNIIVINSSSRGKAEDLLALLRKTLCALPVTSITPDFDITETMTEWLTVDSTQKFINYNKFTLGMEANFNSLGDESASAVVKNQDLNGDEVKAHLDAGQYVTKVALDYDELMSFMLHDDLSIKRIKFSEEMQLASEDIEDVQGQLKASFTLKAGEINRMLGDLFSEFGDSTSNYLEV